MVRSANVRYSKVRPLHPLCQFDVCRHEVRYGCQREDSCSFAHSVIELKCWVLQQDTGHSNSHTHTHIFLYYRLKVQIHRLCTREHYDDDGVMMECVSSSMSTCGLRYHS